MPIGISEDHREVARAFASWAASVDGPGTARSAEGDPAAGFEKAVAAAAAMGLFGIPADGGSVLDLAVALEACATALVPGALLGTCVASVVCPELDLASGETRVALALGEVVHDAPGASHVLVVGDDEVRLVPMAGIEPAPGLTPDLTRRVGLGRVPDGVGDVVTATPDDVRRLLVTLAAAEASGVARWCLDTAVEHAKVREQFGRPIGAFQAVKHLCAQMLETSESVTSTAWDAARAHAEPAEQHAWACAVAGTIALDGAVEVAQACIQVLGGIGFTFEHDAHLYLRRALGLRAMLPPSSAHAASLAGLAAAGTRRLADVDLVDLEDDVRERVRQEVAAVATRPPEEHRRALADSGLLMPHWPAPYGRGAGAAEQLVVDQELAAAGITRPDLAIGAWAAPTVIAHGTVEQQERFVAATLRGDLTWCQLFSEPGAGSDLASLRTRAERDDAAGGWRLTGQKVWTSLAREADWGICLARTDPDAPPHAGITYFLVDMHSPGIDVRPLRELTGEAMFNEVFLDDVLVTDDLVVGEVGGGWRLARTTLANERVAMAGAQLGVSAERAVSLLGDTGQEGARDADTVVAVGRAVAWSAVVQLLGGRATSRSLAGAGPGPESSVAKLVGVRSRQDSAELVVTLLGDRLFGGEELARDALHEQLLTRCLSIAGGTTQVLRNVAGERILGLPRG